MFENGREFSVVHEHSCLTASTHLTLLARSLSHLIPLERKIKSCSWSQIYHVFLSIAYSRIFANLFERF